MSKLTQHRVNACDCVLALRSSVTGRGGEGCRRRQGLGTERHPWGMFRCVLQASIIIIASEEGAGLGGSEGVVAGGHPHEERVFMSVLQAEGLQVRCCLGHLDPANTRL